ncbi:hypothetical protein EST38_g5460 [Candolleomyces aberdarensis]|uniref:Uncharacterized protein n=1 Tax=Candolleomyces aberdarensis TaxID=2316362 RepID=A0A4Q2DM85_9AGAR|nr:hypothetical protein EST38_g5460 [Candolleomyces aberdarensis]
MGETYAEIPDSLIEWIKKQHIFWVASAPLSAEGHVNISPKGVAGTFHIESPTKVWYEDLSGSGAETIAHIRENGRVTILFNAFDGPPRILRLYCKGSFYELGSPEYDAVLPPGTRQPGSRAVIMLDVYKVATTCGYSVPYYSFVGHRTPLLDWAARKEAIDLATSRANPRSPSSAPTPLTSSPATRATVENPKESPSQAPSHPAATPHPNGLLAWWRDRNTFSLDGLLALDLAFRQPSSSLGNHKPVRKARQSALNQYPPSKQPIDDGTLTASDMHVTVARRLWHSIEWLIQCVRWLLLPFFNFHRLLSATITSLNDFFATGHLVKNTLSKPNSEQASKRAVATANHLASIATRIVRVHGEEFQEEIVPFINEATDAQRPPAPWGIEHSKENLNSNASTTITPTTPTATSSLSSLLRTISSYSPWTTSTPYAHGLPTLLLGYGASFLLGMIFAMMFYAEVHSAGTHAAALLFPSADTSISLRRLLKIA